MTGSSTSPHQTGEHPIVDLSTANRGPAGRRWFWVVVGALALLVVVLVLALRWGSPGSPLTIAMVGMAPFVGLPLLFGLGSAVLSRSIELRAAAVAVTAGYLFTMSPIDAVIGCGGRSAADSITVYTANVQFGVGRPEPTAASIAAVDPDVIVLQEASFPFVGALAADPRLAGYEYRSNQLTRQSPRTIIWSRFPIQSYEVEPFVVSDLLSVTLDGPSGPFTVTGVHTLAPVRSRYVPTWSRQFEQLAALDTSSPRLVAGDFNATTDHRPFRDLLDGGWTDVHDEAGCGFDATWPVDQGLPISVMRLDHVLVTDHFEILDMTFAQPTGGDHKPVVATIRLR
jgi:endonuclease/exonuclease/phosphatase family metal-dependent hydrolase